MRGGLIAGFERLTPGRIFIFPFVKRARFGQRGFVHIALCISRLISPQFQVSLRPRAVVAQLVEQLIRNQ